MCRSGGPSCDIKGELSRPRSDSEGATHENAHCKHGLGGKTMKTLAPYSKLHVKYEAGLQTSVSPPGPSPALH
jgi:hypothetical protein